MVDILQEKWTLKSKNKQTNEALDQLFQVQSRSVSVCFSRFHNTTTHNTQDLIAGLQKCHRCAKSDLISLLVKNSYFLPKCSDRFPWWGWHYRPQEKTFSTRLCKKMWVSEVFQLEPNTPPTSKHWISQSLQAKSKSGGDTLSSPNNTILMQVSRASLNLKLAFFPEVRFRPTKHYTETLVGRVGYLPNGCMQST